MGQPGGPRLIALREPGALPGPASRGIGRAESASTGWLISFGSVLRRGGRHGEAVDEVVERVGAVPLHPSELQATRHFSVKVDQRFPQVAVRHWLASRAGPTLCQPLFPPTVPKTIDYVRAVAHYLQRARQRARCVEGSRDLHALVGGASGGAAAPTPARHSPSPTAGARVAQASTVCVDPCSRSRLLGAPVLRLCHHTSMPRAPVVLVQWR